jgi:hypothetical protein
MISVKNKYYWSCSPGNFVNIVTGESISVVLNDSTRPVFIGSKAEWYETLIEIILYAYEKVSEPTNSIYVSSELLRVLE